VVSYKSVSVDKEEVPLDATDEGFPNPGSTEALYQRARAAIDRATRLRVATANPMADPNAQPFTISDTQADADAHTQSYANTRTYTVTDAGTYTNPPTHPTPYWLHVEADERL